MCTHCLQFLNIIHLSATTPVFEGGGVCWCSKHWSVISEFSKNNNLTRTFLTD